MNLFCVTITTCRVSTGIGGQEEGIRYLFVHTEGLKSVPKLWVCWKGVTCVKVKSGLPIGGLWSMCVADGFAVWPKK